VESSVAPPYLLKALDDDDSEWNLVEKSPRTTMMPTPDRTGFMPQTTTVDFADGKTRFFDPNEYVLIGPVTERLGGDRQHISEVADGHGWERSAGEDKDVFSRGEYGVEVYYEGETAVEALRFYQGKQKPFPFTGAAAKSAAINWLEQPLAPAG
jgi:hypothetical protein